jgi:DNA-binding transcriptional LysR family regulator
VPRGGREVPLPTLWQLEAFRTAAQADSWDDAIEALDVTTKHEIIRAVERLQIHLGLRRAILIDRGNRPHVPDHLTGLVDEVDKTLTHWKAARDVASGIEHTFYIRLDGYWSHVENFAAASIVDFHLAEESEPSTKVKVQLVPGFGTKRDFGGMGMTKELQGSNPRVDAVIAPDDNLGRIEGLKSLPLYRWVLLAAIRLGHPIERTTRDRTIDLEVLEKYPLAASPRGHRSRDLLNDRQSAARLFDIPYVSDEPAALLALGQGGDIVPIIASDTKMPVGPWLGTKQVRVDHTAPLPRSWLAIRKTESEVLFGAYRFYWREDTDDEGNETEEASVIRRFGEQLQRDAKPIDELVHTWKGYLPDMVD